MASREEWWRREDKDDERTGRSGERKSGESKLWPRGAAGTARRFEVI